MKLSNNTSGASQVVALASVFGVIMTVIILALLTNGFGMGGKSASQQAALSVGGAQVNLPQQAAGQANIATVQIGDGQPKPIANLRSRVKDCDAGTYFASTQVGRAIQVYAANTDPSDSNANPILNMTAGGSDTSAVLYSNTDYKVIFTDLNDPAGINHGYYDKSYFGGSRGSVTAGKLTAPATTTATVDVTIVFDDEKCVIANGTFVNLFNGNSTTGNRLNGQTNYTRQGSSTGPAGTTITCSNGSGTAEPELVVGTNCYPAVLDPYRSETVYYNQSQGDGTFYIDLEFGAAESNTRVYDPVTCFKDSDGDMNKTQFSAISASHQSGDPFNVPSDLLSYWTNDDCFHWFTGADKTVKGGLSGIYRITFTTSATTNFWEQGQEFEIVSDDMGGWFAQDLHNSRVVPQSRLTIDTEYTGNEATQTGA